MTDEGVDVPYRGEMLGKIAAAIRPRVPLTAEKHAATVEALCLTTATVFLRHASVPYSRGNVLAMTAAIFNAAADWAASQGDRN